MEKYNFCNNTNPTNLTNEESKELTVLIEIPDTKKTHKQKVKENELKFILA
jgi:hypothetical protein